jgi:hypothetical protein
MVGGAPLRRRSGGLSGLAVRGHAPAARGGQGGRVSVAGTIVGGFAGLLLGAALWGILGVHQPKSGSASGMAPELSPAWAPDCTVLTLDRRQGHTTAGPCVDHVPALRQADARARP